VSARALLILLTLYGGVARSQDVRRTVLDTMKVTAARIDSGHAEFEERRRSGVGRYITEADLARRNVAYTSEVFRSVPGVGLHPDVSGGRNFIVQRGIFAGTCSPAVFINGVYVSETIDTDAIDNLVNPRELFGIEIYPPGTAPPQYQRGLSGCGSVLFWTKDPRSATKRRITKGRMLAALVTVTSLVGVSRMFGPH
jgi:hypothetical protein